MDYSNARIVFQGLEGAYSQEAMEQFFGENCDSFHVDTWKDAMEAIRTGKADYAVLPIENSSAGIVSENYDLLVEYDNYIVDKLQGLDVLLLEANHDVHMLQAGTYPYQLKRRILGDRGHLSNDLSGQLLGKVLHDGFKKVILGHLSKENNYPQLAWETVRMEVTMGENPYKGSDFPMVVAKRDEVSELVRI